MRERLLAWLERWTGLPLTREGAEIAAAEHLDRTWNRLVDDLDARLAEESKKPPRPAP